MTEAAVTEAAQLAAVSVGAVTSASRLVGNTLADTAGNLMSLMLVHSNNMQRQTEDQLFLR